MPEPQYRATGAEAPGGGLVFSMRAPQSPMPSPGPNVATAAGGARLSLLLVEDDRADALLVEELIADAAGEFDYLWCQTISKPPAR